MVHSNTFVGVKKLCDRSRHLQKQNKASLILRLKCSSGRTWDFNVKTFLRSKYELCRMGCGIVRNSVVLSVDWILSDAPREDFLSANR